MSRSPLVLRSVLDSGKLHESSNYTTVVLIHGLMWQGTGFKKLLLFSSRNNSRVVALNRRGYPGSEPYTPEELERLTRLADSGSGSPNKALVEELMREQARELFDWLVEFVRRENVPRTVNEGGVAKGGIVVVGWSYGCRPLLAFLAHAHSFEPQDGVDLSLYIRRVLFYDSSFITFGYPRPPDSHHPLYDAPTPTERLARFHAWVTGYYAHGIGLSFGNAVADTDISVEERTACTYIAPGLEPDGSDVLVARACGRVDIYTTLKDTVLYTGTQANADADADIDSQDARRSRWAGVQMRVVWCERSIWPAVWCAQCFSDEVEASQKLGKQMRPVQVVRVPDANHFAHWDYPERILQAFLGD